MSSIDTGVFKEHYDRDFRRILGSIEGNYSIIADKQLHRYLKDLFLGEEPTQERKEHPSLPIALTAGPLDSKAQNAVYFLRPELSVLRVCIEQIKHAQQVNPAIENFHIYFVPRCTKLCMSVLQEHQLHHVVQTGVLAMEMIPIEEDVLSLEMGNAYRDLFLNQDPTCLYYIARSLIKMQAMFGVIPNVKGKGDQAYAVCQLMQKMQQQQKVLGEEASYVPSQIDNLIVIDRSVDTVSPFLTQMTYEGLIDEFFAIKNSRIVVDEAITGGKGNARREHLLNSDDQLFSEIRNFNFAVLGPYLYNRAATIKDTYQERHDAKSVNEMQKFIKKFKSAHSEHTFLQTHINLAEYISKTTRSVKFDRRLEVERFMLQGDEVSFVENYIADAIAKQEPAISVLRLMCLLSQTCGLKKSKYDFLKREFVQTYGFEMLFTLNNLESIGLLNSDYYKFYNGARKYLKLIQNGFEGRKVQNPPDISFAYSGYAPLAVKLCEIAVKPGWKRIEDTLNSVPGRAFSFNQQLEAKPERKAPTNGEGKAKQTTLVVFVGGITFAEISAFRNLSERADHDQQYIMMTTKLLNGTSLLKSVKEPIQNNLDIRSVFG